MYGNTGDQAQQFLAMGGTKEMYEDFKRSLYIDIYPENLLAFLVFQSMQTQWRVSMNGYTGLDYNALPQVMNLASIEEEDRLEVFKDVQVMEVAALKIMAEQRKS